MKSHEYDSEGRLSKVTSGAGVSYWYDTEGRRIKKEEGGKTTYYHGDRTSVRMITDESGKVVGIQDQEPYGEMISESGEKVDRKFTSYTRDDGTGMDYAVNRDYQTSIGRYGQPDRIQGSIRNPQTLNRYSYVTNDPINLVDPLGLEGTEDLTIRDEINVQAKWAYWGWWGGNYIPRYMPMLSLSDEGVGGYSIPSLPAGTPEKYIKPFNEAFIEAKGRIENKEKCAELFGGEDIAISALQSSLYRFVPLGSPKRQSNGDFSVQGAATMPKVEGKTRQIFINSEGPFINQTFTIPGGQNRLFDFGTGLRGRKMGALILLHELGHVVGIFGSDIADPKLNKSYTQKVLDNCF